MLFPILLCQTCLLPVCLCVLSAPLTHYMAMLMETAKLKSQFKLTSNISTMQCMRRFQQFLEKESTLINSLAQSSFPVDSKRSTESATVPNSMIAHLSYMIISHMNIQRIMSQIRMISNMICSLNQHRDNNSTLTCQLTTWL